MTDFAAEFARVFAGNCKLSATDWNQAQAFDGSSDENCYAGEAALVASLTSEAYSNYGIEVDYYPKEISTKRDEIFGEDQLENIVRRFKLKVYTESVPNLQRQYTLQGMVYTEIITVQCTIAHFAEASMYNADQTAIVYDDSLVPKIGDIMYLKYADLYYEVANVKTFGDNSSFLGVPITYTFTLRVWRNNHEDVNIKQEHADTMPIQDFTNLAETFDVDMKQATVAASGDILSVNNIIETDKENIREWVRDDNADPFDGW